MEGLEKREYEEEDRRDEEEACGEAHLELGYSAACSTDTEGVETSWDKDVCLPTSLPFHAAQAAQGSLILRGNAVVLETDCSGPSLEIGHHDVHSLHAERENADGRRNHAACMNSTLLSKLLPPRASKSFRTCMILYSDHVAGCENASGRDMEESGFEDGRVVRRGRSCLGEIEDVRGSRRGEASGCGQIEGDRTRRHQCAQRCSHDIARGVHDRCASPGLDRGRGRGRGHGSLVLWLEFQRVDRMDVLEGTWRHGPAPRRFLP